ncbi:P-loop containing nucleoside triphosphate hydrolase protein [Chytridium lagenaria]|nr:P-loop containing nucleoside triphosphate hydrolase protein [Chytridium lagenaria]
MLVEKRRELLRIVKRLSVLLRHDDACQMVQRRGYKQQPNFERTPYPKKLIGRTYDSGFVDLKWIKVSSGAGGDGGIHFWKSTRNPMGPPCGGNGGKGGNLYVKASKEVTSLGGVLNSYRAPDGGQGGAKQMHGADGKAVEIVLPVGTCIRQVDSPQALALRLAALKDQGVDSEILKDLKDEVDEETAAMDRLDLIRKHFKFRTGYVPHEDRMSFLKDRIPPPTPPSPPVCMDLTKDGERHLLIRGGRGGVGNPHFATNDIKGPPVAGKGEPSKTIWLELELKSIADAGLVGLPNAGKSTLLSAISNAHPKIAPYPFTTLNPYIGTIDFPDFYTMTVADIPGLIEGAHMNVGLGHTFLRHVERSHVLVFVIDVSGKDPARDYVTLRNELEAYNSALCGKPAMVIANKADLGGRVKENLGRLVEAVGEVTPVVPISALERKNITVATGVLRKM